MKKYYNNPKDLINETYNGDRFPLVDKKINAWVMPLDMLQDADSLAYKRFYGQEWERIISDVKANSIH